MHLRRLGSLLLVGLLTAACGTTVTQAPSAQGPASDGLSAGGNGQLPAGQTGPGVSPTGVTGQDSGPGSTQIVAGSGSGAGQQGGGSTAGSPLTGAAGGAATGRGFTKTTIRVGVGVDNDYNTFVKSTGLKGLTYDGDPNVWFQAAIDDINKHGGLLGRKLELVKANFSTAQELNDPATANQAACTTWTQDKPVFAVLLAGFTVEDTLLKCLNNAHTPLIAVGGGLDYPLHYAESYAKYPLFINLDQMLGETFDRLAIGRLQARGFFAPWDTKTGKPGNATTPTKVGIVGFDDHDGALQLASQQQQLKRYGIPSTSVACPRPVSQKTSCEQSTELRFASSGVTHVFGADSIFMNSANSQGYHPRYWVAVQPAIFAANEGPSQLTGSMSENYVPYLDVPPSKYPGDPTPATGRCKTLMKAAGQQTTDPSTLWLQSNVCDEFSFFRAAVLKAGSLGATQLVAGLEALGSSVQSAMTWSASFGPGAHASATVLRDLSYDPASQNYYYVSKTDYR